MSDKVKRSYYMPVKLLKAFDQFCEKGGCVREHVVAAAVNHFLNATPAERAKMFNQLDVTLNKRG